MTAEFSNAERSNRFEAAMLALGDLYEYELPMLLLDLLADARHWCDAAGLSFAEFDRRAYDHYLHEIHHNPGDRP
jgi:hypothetical protein